MKWQKYKFVNKFELQKHLRSPHFEIGCKAAFCVLCKERKKVWQQYVNNLQDYENP